MIHFVGAGPGAADLITTRGAALLGAADVVVFAGSLVNPELLLLAPEGCEVHDSSRMTLEQVIDVMVTATERGKDVVRLHTGDPCLYGAIREQMDALDERGIAFDVTPGVSSMGGAAASLAVEYTLPGVSQSVIITRQAGRTPVPDGERVRDLARHGASMAIFLSAGLVREVQQELLNGGRAADEPAAIVYKATWPDERVVRTCVGELADAAQAADVHKTALILVGGFLGHDYERSRLYEPTFTTEYRGASHASTTRTTPVEEAPVRIVSFTDRGEALAERLAAELGGVAWRCASGELGRWTQEGFCAARALVFVGATGIAVRAIAPYAHSKASDSAVVVVDDQGRYAIPVLSGHLGGANDLARRIARTCGAQAVITTATDGSGVWAVDEWARRQGCVVANPERIKDMSAKLLAGGTVRVYSEWPLPEATPAGVELVATPDGCDVLLGQKGLSPLPQTPLRIVPRILTLGVGCRKGTPYDVLRARLEKFMKRTDYDLRGIAQVCSVDAKKDEPGIVALCAELGVPFVTFAAERLARVAGDFASSDFVRQTVGVDNVCERAAVLGSGGELVCGKDAAEGVTLALASAPFAPDWRWTDE